MTIMKNIKIIRSLNFSSYSSSSFICHRHIYQSSSLSSSLSPSSSNSSTPSSSYSSTFSFPSSLFSFFSSFSLPPPSSSWPSQGLTAIWKSMNTERVGKWRRESESISGKDEDEDENKREGGGGKEEASKLSVGKTEEEGNEEGWTKLFYDITILWWRGRLWKGTYWPSKWRYYHRHGYWATRKKKLKFDKYRPYRYHEVKGYGKPKLQWWQNKSFYRPLNLSTRFW